MNRLKDIFYLDELQFKVQASGKGKNGQMWCLMAAYVDARAIQNRIEEVFGLFGCSISHRVVGEGVICTLTIIDPETGREVIKEDGAALGQVVNGDNSNSLKAGISGALKRVASSGLGIGRYLYDLKDLFSTEILTDRPKDTTDYINAKLKDGNYYWVKKPILPYDSYKHRGADAPAQPKETILDTNTGVNKLEDLRIETTGNNTSEKLLTNKQIKSMLVPGGIHKGLKLVDVYKTNPKTIEWLRSKTNDKKILYAIDVLDSYKEKGYIS